MQVSINFQHKAKIKETWLYWDSNTETAYKKKTETKH